MPSIRLHDIHKQFSSPDGPVTAVDGISLEVSSGEIVAVLGPNGAGKTTTIDMLLGLTAPTSGHVELFDRAPRKAIEDGLVGAVLQTGGLLSDLSVIETVQAVAALQSVGRERVDAVIAQARLQKLARRKVSKCSGGEQQRLKFALSLLTDPQLLVLDEPTTGMDPVARRDFWSTMRSQADQGRTILFATHYLEEAQDFAQRVVLIDGGRVIADGPVAQMQNVVSGRVVEATLPDGDPDVVATLKALAHVSRVDVSGRHLRLVSGDSDAVLRLLFDAGAHDLLVTAPTLESAFVALTGKN